MVVLVALPMKLSSLVLFLLYIAARVNSSFPFGIQVPIQSGHKTTDRFVDHYDITNNDVKVQKAENVVKEFMTSSGYNSDDNDTKFHIHGWKWHTMSLIHEARRLNRFAMKIRHQQLEVVDATPTVGVGVGSSDQMMMTDDCSSALRTVAEYIVDFNMRALHRIENEVFFPMVRQKEAIPNTVLPAFTTILNQLDRDRSAVAALGTSLITEVSIASNRLESLDSRTRAVENVALHSAAIAESTQAMLHREVEIVIPFISRYFTKQEQLSLNNQVLRKLGILDSRLHLVGMYEAIVHNTYEYQLFQHVIPSVAQRLIPRWKRLMYDPRAGALDGFLR